MSYASLRSARVTGRRTAASLLLLAFSETMALAYAQPKPQRHIVLIEAVGYSPMTLDVKAGDTVVWKNRDPFPHNVTADNVQFHSGDIAPEKTWEVRLDKRGRFPYVCTLHPGMKGVVTVK